MKLPSSFVLLVLALPIAFIPSTLAQEEGFGVNQTCPKSGGYVFSFDVGNEARLDLRVKTLEEESDEADWGESRNAYSGVLNGSSYSIISLAKSRVGDMNKEGMYNAYKNYWNSATYADVFISNALGKSGEFREATDAFRAECATKGAQYQAVWMWIIHTMEEAINNCGGDGAIKSWDQAIAFYTGSLVNTGGIMPFSLATKRCGEFDTCGSGGNAPVNDEIMKQFRNGREELLAGGSCNLVETKNIILRQMTIPLMQGLISYVYNTANDNANPASVEKKGKSHGEGWAFAAAILPLIANCNSGIAKTIDRNFRPSANPPMSSSVNDVINDLSKVYGCLGFNCADIGKRIGESDPKCRDTDDAFKPLKGTTGKSESNSGDFSNAKREDVPDTGTNGGGGGLSGAAIGGIIAAVIILVVVLGFLFVYRRRKSSKGVVPSLHEGNQSSLETSL